MTSVDWASHPTLTHADTPERIDVVIVNGDPNPNRPDLPHYGAGETVCKPTMAAVANAIFDATGVRLRRVPFRDARVLAALKAAECRRGPAEAGPLIEGAGFRRPPFPSCGYGSTRTIVGAGSPAAPV